MKILSIKTFAQVIIDRVNFFSQSDKTSTYTEVQDAILDLKDSFSSEESSDFKVNCEGCGVLLGNSTVVVGMGKIEAYSFKCKKCSSGA